MNDTLQQEILKIIKQLRENSNLQELNIYVFYFTYKSKGHTYQRVIAKSNTDIESAWKTVIREVLEEEDNLAGSFDKRLEVILKTEDILSEYLTYLTADTIKEEAVSENTLLKSFNSILKKLS